MEEQDFVEQSLAQLSVDSIVLNFERFMIAYTSNNSAIPPKHFEFLQRTQSKSLLHKLLLSDNLQKIDQVRDNLNFLVNRHLKEIDLDMFFQNSIPCVAERLKVIGDTITGLKLSGTEYYAEQTLLEITSYVPNVQSLSLYGACVTEKVLQNIGEHCTALETLNVPYCPSVEDRGIQALCRANDTNKDSDENHNTDEVCQNFTLQHLDIRDTSVTVVGIAFILKNFPNLAVIKHEDVFEALCNIHFEDFQNNCLPSFKTYNLKELIISLNVPGADYLKMCSVVCPELSKLHVFNIMSQTEVAALLEFTALTEVEFSITISNLQISNTSAFISLTPFIKACGKNLEIITFADASVSMELLVKFCRKLKHLHLRRMNFEPMEELQHNLLNQTFQNLKDLALEGINLENEAKSVKLLFSSSPNLKKVSFRNTESLTLNFVNSLSPLSCMKNVRDLDVSYSDIDFPTAQALLLSAPRLKYYDIQNCDMSYEDYGILFNLRPSVKLIWGNDDSEYSVYDHDGLDFDDMDDYDYFDYDYDGDSDYGDPYDLEGDFF